MIVDVNKWLQLDAERVLPSPKGGLHIEIENLEDLLDDCTAQNWSTQNFNFAKTADGECYGCLQLILEYVNAAGDKVQRSFIGASNFMIADILPLTDWAATLKSYCVKNAASDAGRKLGRHLNKGLLPSESAGKDKPKVNNKLGNTLKAIAKQKV